MFALLKNPGTHAQRLERWLGVERVEHLSNSMKGWYGPPIALGGVPGTVFVDGKGDIRGLSKCGQFMSAVDFAILRMKKAFRDDCRRQLYQSAMGFSNLSALIAAATGGNLNQMLPFSKVGVTGVLGSTNTLWFEGTQPAAGAAAGAAPGGTVPTSATTGALPFTNPTTGTTHFVRMDVLSSVAAMSLMLYDRIFSVTKTMSSVATEAVTGVPTRYTSQTSTAADYIGGNFMFPEIRAALGATAHNWTVCQYTDQAGASSNFPSFAGLSSGIAKRLDMNANTWFAPLASGDSGIKAITQLQCDASVTGNVDFTIGHPIAMIPCPIANIVCVLDGINTAFNLQRIFDNACLAFLEIIKSATTATTYVGQSQIVSG